jgi:hypothetical protein
MPAMTSPYYFYHLCGRNVGATGGSREWPQRDFCTTITVRNGKSIFTNLESSQALGNSREPPAFTFFGLIRNMTKIA